MPLPDVQTLQNSDALDAQRNPAFMQEPITTPTEPGVAAPPIAPQQAPAPPPPPNSPRGLSNNDLFSQDLVNKVNGAGTTRTPGDLNTIDYSEAKTGTDRYPTYQSGADNEEIYGLNQSPLKQLAFGVLKGVALAGGTFLQGMMSIPDVIHAIGSGKVSDLYNSPVESGVDDWMKNLDTNVLPNYITHAQENRGILNALPFSGGSANFWGNTVIKNLGFVAGAIGSAMVQDAAVGAVTSGVGDLPLVAEQFGKASLWMNKILQGTKNVVTGSEDLGKTAQLLQDASKLGRTSEQILDLQKIQEIAAGQRIGTGARYMVNLYTSARTMSSGGARQEYESTKDDLTKQYIEKNGYQPIGQDLQNIEDTATASGNTKFALDTALMAVQEGVNFDNILSPFGSARGKYISEAQRATGVDLANVGFKEGTTTLEYQGNTSLPGKVWSAVKPLASSALGMGAVMGTFYGTGVGIKNFYEEKYDGKIRGTLADMIHATGDSLVAAFGTKEGLEQTFIGALTGALMGLGAKGLERFKGTPGSAETRQSAIDTMNAETVSGFMSNNFDSAAKSLSNAEKMRAATKAGNVFDYENLQHDEFVNYAITHAKNKMPEVGYEKIRQLKELSPTELVKQFGFDSDTPENRQAANDYVDGMLKEYKSIIKTRKLLDDTFTNPFTPGRFASKEEKEQSAKEGGPLPGEKYNIFEHWKDTLAKFASISRNVADRVDKAGKAVADLFPNTDVNTLSNITNPHKLWKYNDSLRAKANDLREALKDDITSSRKEDRNHLDFLDKLTGELDKILGRDTADDTFMAFSKYEDMPTFEKLVNYTSNGEGVPKGDFEGVPKEALVGLLSNAGEINKLNFLKEEAGRYYDALSTKKGFENFYNTQSAKQAAQTDPEPTKTLAGGLGTGDQTATPTPEADTKESFPVHNPHTKETVQFTKGQTVYVYPKGGKGNPVKGIFEGSATDNGAPIVEKGSQSVQVNINGTSEEVDNSRLFKAPKVTKETPVPTPVTDPVPTPPTPNKTQEEIDKEGDKRPDITVGLISTSTPVFSDPDETDNFYHRRAQNFAFDLGSYDPTIFNQENRKFLKIQLVTPKTQEAAGFKKDWIKDSGGDDNSIRALVVIHNKDGIFYADSKGNPLGRVGEPIKPELAIYSHIRNSNPINDAGQEKYTNKFNIDEKKALADWEARRQYWLNATDINELIPQNFTVSRGIEQTNSKANNSIIKAGLISDSDLFKSIISVPSIGDTVLNPIVDESGEGIGTSKESVPISDGKPMLNYGGNLTFLNNAVLNPQEASKVFDLLKFYSDETKEASKKALAIQHIKETIYTILGDSEVSRKKNTIAIKVINKATGEEHLFLGQKGENKANPDKEVGIPLNPASLEDNKDEITQFLEIHAYHNTHKPTLNNLINKVKSGNPEDIEYREYGVKDGELEVTKTWPTYNHYLLSDEGGRVPPLTTHIQTPQGGSRPMISKYLTLENTEVTFTPRPQEVKVEGTHSDQEDEIFQRPVKNSSGEIKIFEYIPEKNAQGQEIKVKKVVGYRIGNINAELVAPKNPQAVEAFLNKLIQADIVPMDDSNAPKEVTSFFGKGLTAGPEAQTSFINILPNDYTKIDIVKETREITRMLGDNFPIHQLEHVIKVTSGGLAYGMFYNNAIYIWKQAKSGTGYHEVFEAVHNTFLSGKEQLDLFKEFIGRKGSFQTYDGTYKTYESANFKEAKEKMADEFDDFKQNPKNDVPPKQKSFFRRLIDFIKRVIFGPTDLINKLFEKINRGEFRDVPHKVDSDIRDPQYSMVRNLGGFPEALKQDTLNGMTAIMMQMVFGGNRDFLDVLENKEAEAGKDVYNRLLANLTHYYEAHENGFTIASIYDTKLRAAKGDLEIEKSIKNEAIAIINTWNGVKARWPEFVEAHKQALKQYNIKFSTDEEGNTTLDDLEDYIDENDRTQGDYTRDDLSYDGKKNASNIIKLIFATIADSKRAQNGDLYSDRSQSLARLPKLANYSSLFNYTLYQSANMNGIGEIWDHLKEVAKEPIKNINANLQRLLNRIAADNGFSGKSIADGKILLALENVLVKNKPNFANQFVDEKGNTYNTGLTLNNRARQIKDTWVANMKESPLVKVVGNSFVFKTPGKYASSIDFANALGIDIKKSEYNALKPGTRSTINEDLTAIKAVIGDLAKSGKKVNILNGDSVDFDTRLNKIADIYTSHIIGEDSGSQHLNLDNKATSTFILNSPLSYLLNDANNSGTLEEFYHKQPHMTDIFRKDSYIINNVMFKDGKYSKKVEVTVIEGRRSIAGNVAASKLTLGERILAQVNDNLAGIFYTLVPADGKNEYGENPGTFLNASTYFKGDRASQIAKFHNIMYGYLKTEVALAKDFLTNPIRQKVLNLNKPLGDGVKGSSLRFFYDLLPKDIVNKIHTDVIKGNTPLEEAFPISDMKPIIGKFVADRAKSTLGMLVDGQVFEYNDFDKRYKLNGVDRNTLDLIDKGKVLFDTKDVQHLMAFREMNFIVGVIEQHKLLFGDPAAYDNDELKRTKSFLGGTEYLHVDNYATDRGFNKWADQVFNMAHGPHGIPLEPQDPGYHAHKNYANTVTLHDVKVNSSSYADLVKVLGEKVAAPYKNLDEADASVFHHPLHYREVLYKSGGRFTSGQEREFQRHMAYERLKKEELKQYEYTNPKLKDADNELLRKQPFGDPKVTFPILKLKAAGTEFRDGVAIEMLDKAAWAPIFYEWAEGTQNLDMYNAMSAGNIDYLRVKSAHKVGTQSDSYVPLYNTDGTINQAGIKSATPEQVPHNTLGIQVEQQTKKGGNTEGSQLKALVPSDLYDNAVPIDYIDKFKGDKNTSSVEWNKLTDNQKDKESPIHKLIGEHEEILNQMAIKRVNNLLKQWKAKENEDGTFTIGDKTNIAKFLNDEITRRELPDNIRMGLTINPATGDFYAPLESSIRFKELRSILYSKIDKTILRPKIHGGPKTQRAVTGFETGPRSMNGDKLASNLLPFYSQGEDGTTIPSGNLIPQPFGDRVMDKLREIHGFKSEREALNHLYKELNKTVEGRKLLTIVGFRIPTQADNSIEVSKTEGFLHAQMGDVVVSPSEITAKSGSDFDVDKLNTYSYNTYIGEGGIPKLIKFETVDTNNEDTLKDYYDRVYRDDRNEWENFQKQKKSDASNPFQALAEQVFGEEVENGPEEPDYVPTEEEFLAEAKGANPYQLNSIKALENKYIETIQKIMLLKEKFKGLVTPNDASPLKSVSGKTVDLQELPESTKEKPVYGQMLDSTYTVKGKEIPISDEVNKKIQDLEDQKQKEITDAQKPQIELSKIPNPDFLKKLNSSEGATQQRMYTEIVEEHKLLKSILDCL